jgi:hypothetical protein
MCLITLLVLEATQQLLFLRNMKMVTEGFLLLSLKRLSKNSSLNCGRGRGWDVV